MAATIEEVTTAELEEQARQYLTNTDWMVKKSVDDATYVIPPAVIEKRIFARTLIDTVDHKARVIEITPIFYNEPDHLLAFKNLIVFKSAQTLTLPDEPVV